MLHSQSRDEEAETKSQFFKCCFCCRRLRLKQSHQVPVILTVLVLVAVHDCHVAVHVHHAAGLAAAVHAAQGRPVLHGGVLAVVRQAGAELRRLVVVGEPRHLRVVRDHLQLPQTPGGHAVPDITWEK